MNELGALPGDQRGHILASQLCGPATNENLTPQTAALNQNRGRPGRHGWNKV